MGNFETEPFEGTTQGKDAMEQENRGEKVTSKKDATAKKTKNRLSAKAMRELAEKITALADEGHPVEAMAGMCGISLIQTQNIWTSLVQEGRLQPRPPKYRIFETRLTISMLFSGSGKYCEKVKVIHNEDGSVTLSPISEA